MPALSNVPILIKRDHTNPESVDGVGNVILTRPRTLSETCGLPDNKRTMPLSWVAVIMSAQLA